MGLAPKPFCKGCWPRPCSGSVARSRWLPRPPRRQTSSPHAGRGRVDSAVRRAAAQSGVQESRKIAQASRVCRSRRRARPGPAPAPPPAARPRPAGLLGEVTSQRDGGGSFRQLKGDLGPEDPSPSATGRGRAGPAGPGAGAAALGLPHRPRIEALGAAGEPEGDGESGAVGGRSRQPDPQ